MASAGDAISLRQYLDLNLDDIPSSSPAAPPSYGNESEWEPSEPPSEMSEDRSDDLDCDVSEQVYHKEAKYIVFTSSLETLMKWCHCPSCGNVDFKRQWCANGTELTVHLSCQACNEVNSWSSQPRIGKFAGGNLLLSAGTLFAGASPGKVLRVLEIMDVSSYDRRTFFSHQRNILQPAIKTVWKEQQESHISLLQSEGRSLVLGEDGRADSPGHCAKFGTSLHHDGT